MKNPFRKIQKSLAYDRDIHAHYRRLAKHLNEQPVGFPSTPSGVELRLLEEMFTLEEADLALHLTWKAEDFDTIYFRAREKGYSRAELRAMLEAMEEKGGIFVRSDGEGGFTYSLHPFVVGMFETRLKKMTPSYYMDTRKYVAQGFAFEYLTTEVPQMRVIPINRSVDSSQNIATYDQIRKMVREAGGRIGVSDCICKKSKDLVGDPCQITDRREVCIGFRDFADMWSRQGWGRTITEEEALEILDQNEKDGLVLIAATMQEPQFVCSCCSCCCGITNMLKIVPRPVDYVASNFHARVDADACNGCHKCVGRCQFRAVRAISDESKAPVAVDLKRCVGCGLCVPTCKQDAIALVEKTPHFVPPQDHDALNELLLAKKKGKVAKTVAATRALAGVKRSPTE